MNDKNIEDTIGSLKALSTKQETSTQVLKLQLLKSPYQ